MTDKLHVDATLVAAHRMAELQAENEQLRANVAEHELLFAIALENDRTLQEILTGIGKLLPGVEATASGIVDAVANIVLELDARKDAADPAFDEIVELCGLAKTWEYPGQVIRDVRDALKKRDDQLQAMRACIVYARDRRGGAFDFDNWIRMVEHALGIGSVPPHALEDAQAMEAQAWQAIANIRKERDELRERLRFAEVVRGDARRASQRYLDDKRNLRVQLEQLQVHVAVQPVRSIQEMVAESVALRDRIRNMSTPQHSTECGTAYRGCSPHCGFALAQAEDGEEDGDDPCLAHTFVGDVCRDCGLVAPRHVDGVRQCPWILDDEDPDEGYWHCKHEADHVGVHETEFGKGRDRRWKTPPDARDEMVAMADSQFAKENPCACSPKYRELAPGVHAAYCPLKGMRL